MLANHAALVTLSLPVCVCVFVCPRVSSAAVSKNNVFMPSSFCQSPTGNSDSEPGKRACGHFIIPRLGKLAAVVIDFALLCYNVMKGQYVALNK